MVARVLYDTATSFPVEHEPVTQKVIIVIKQTRICNSHEFPRNVFHQATIECTAVSLRAPVWGALHPQDWKPLSRLIAKI